LANYESKCSQLLSEHENTKRIDLNSRLFNFHNYSSNSHPLSKTFRNTKFDIVKEKKVSAHEHEGHNKKKKTT